MRTTSYFTSDKIIDAVKRKIAFPISQNTFDEDDILAFANEEMLISQVPSVMQYHEEYFVNTVTVPLESNISRYPIPDRAIGDKIRDIFYVDSQGTEHEMTQISSEDRTSFSDNYGVGNIHKFYFEDDDIVLLTGDSTRLVGALKISIFLRPNQLVRDESAAIATSFVKQIVIDNSILVSGDILTINSTPFEAGVDFTIGATSIDTATSLSSAISATSLGSASNGTVSTNIVTFRYNLRTTTITSDSLGLAVSDLEGIEFNQIPTNFSNSMTIDFLQTRASHRTFSYGITLSDNAISNNTIFFNEDEIPLKFKIGDYVCEEYECIIPQIPDDLHIALVERVCARILSAMGDLGGLKDVNDKIKEIEMRQGTLLDNRAEGAPLKVNNTHSLLRYGKRTRSTRRY